LPKFRILSRSYCERALFLSLSTTRFYSNSTLVREWGSGRIRESDTHCYLCFVLIMFRVSRTPPILIHYKYYSILIIYYFSVLLEYQYNSFVQIMFYQISFISFRILQNFISFFSSLLFKNLNSNFSIYSPCVYFFNATKLLFKLFIGFNLQKKFISNEQLCE